MTTTVERRAARVVHRAQLRQAVTDRLADLAVGILVLAVVCYLAALLAGIIWTIPHLSGVI